MLIEKPFEKSGTPMSNALIIEEINKAILAHGAWKMRLREAIAKGNSELPIEDTKRDDCCAFGRWLRSADLDAELKASLTHKTIARLHKDFHQSAGKVLEEAVQDRLDSAISLLEGEFGECSQTLIIALTKWKRELATAKAA